MIAKLFENSPLTTLQEVAGFTQRRQEILASNVANVHTPGFRARDLSVETFQEALKKSIAARHEPAEVSPGFPGHSARLAAAQELKESKENLLYHDGTQIDIERQVVEISKNQYLHNLAIGIMSQQFKLLETAISERI